MADPIPPTTEPIPLPPPPPAAAAAPPPTEPSPIPPPADIIMNDAPAASPPAPFASIASTNGATIPKPPEVQKPPHLRMPEPADYDSKQGAVHVREYLLAKVTPHMLAATKMITCEPWNLPENPLQIIGEYFIEKSKELEQAKIREEGMDGLKETGTS